MDVYGEFLARFATVVWTKNYETRDSTEVAGGKLTFAIRFPFRWFNLDFFWRIVRKRIAANVWAEVAEAIKEPLKTTPFVLYVGARSFELGVASRELSSAPTARSHRGCRYDPFRFFIRTARRTVLNT